MMTAFTAALVFSCWVANLNHGGGGPSHYRGAIFSVVFVLAGYLFSQHRVQIDAAVSHYKGIALAAVPALLVIGWRLAVRNGYVSIIHNEYKSLLLFYASALVTTLALAIFLMLAAKSKANRLHRPQDTSVYCLSGAFYETDVALHAGYIRNKGNALAFASDSHPVFRYDAVCVGGGSLRSAGVCAENLDRSGQKKTWIW